MKLYAVELSTTAVVWAESPDDAVLVAMRHSKRACSDCVMETTYLGEVSSNDSLPQYGWDEHCIPYGHDDSTRIKDLL